MPTADEVAAVITSACFYLDHPYSVALDVASGEVDPTTSTTWRIARVRFYSAVALLEYFELNRKLAGHLVGYSAVSGAAIFSRLKQRSGKGPLWFDRIIVDKIKFALDSAKAIDRIQKKLKDYDEMSLAELSRQRRRAPLGLKVTDQVWPR